MHFELQKNGGEVVQCDSCDFPAPTADFDRCPPFNAPGRLPRRLCEFCCTTMASRHTENPGSDDYTRLRAHVWKAAAGVFHMLNQNKTPNAQTVRPAFGGSEPAQG